MITDIPTAGDFAESGVSFLNLGWSTAIDLVIGIGDSEDSAEFEDDYWLRAQRPLATAITLAQQGTEFLLKSRIAETSPFLLLSTQPREWPRSWQQADCQFAEFRTIDAQDLLKVHDTVCETRLPAGFHDQFERMRRIRNSLVHTVDKSHRFSAKDVLRWILEARAVLAADQSWISHRRRHLESSPGGVFPDYNDCGWGPRLAEEWRATANFLSPSECARLLDVPDKKQRFYFCLGCHWRKADLASHLKTAQLRPNTPESTTAYCYVCEETFPVVRSGCAECPGNVLVPGYDGSECMSCGCWFA